MFPDSAMGIDSSAGSLPWPSCNRRLSLTPARIRLREERKRIIRALDAKYRTIDDHEKGMRKFVLIKNNLRRLQREAREEKLARHRAGLGGSKASNFSPSCLSAATRPRSPSPPCDYGYPDSPVPISNVSSPFFSVDEPSCKRQRLFCDDDKENEMNAEAAFGEEFKVNSPCSRSDEAQEILRDLYETCVNEGITQRSPSPSPYDSSYSSDSTSQSQDSTSFSLSMSTSCSNVSPSNDSSCNNMASSCESEWSRHSQYPFNCGHSSLLGNDLQSVVFHSLITSLES